MADAVVEKLKLLEKAYTIIICLLVVFALILFVRHILDIIVIIALITLGAISMIYQRVVRYSIGIELCIFATVISAVAYGSIIGAIVGFVSLFLAEVLSLRIAPNTFIGLAAISLIGLITPLFWPADIFWLGMGMTILYDAAIIPGYILTGSSPVSSGIFLVTHLMFNYWVFANIAPVVVKLIV